MTPTYASPLQVLVITHKCWIVIQSKRFYEALA